MAGTSMLKQIRKTSEPKIEIGKSVTGEITCGACNHVRKPTDTGPDWQCPGCRKAYSKTSSTPESIKQQRREARQRERQAKEERKQDEMQKGVITAGLTGGAMTFKLGLGRMVSSCAQPLVKTVVAANPALQVLGIAIVLATLIYTGYKYFWQ